MEGDDEMDQDEAAGSNVPDMTPGPMSRDVSEPAPARPILGKEEDDGPSKPASPKPHPLSISFQPASPTPQQEDENLQDALRPPQELEGVEDLGVDASTGFVGELGGDLSGDMSLDMSGIGPDGEQFEGAEDLSQLQSTDALLGGPLLDEGMEQDPFVVPPS